MRLMFAALLAAAVCVLFADEQLDRDQRFMVQAWRTREAWIAFFDARAAREATISAKPERDEKWEKVRRREAEAFARLAIELEKLRTSPDAPKLSSSNQK